MSLFFLALPCFAAPNPSPATLFPTTTAVEAGQVELSAGASAGLLMGGMVGGALAGADLRLGYAPAPGLWTSASVVGYEAGTATALGGGFGTRAAGVSLAAAWDLARRPGLSTGPVMSAAVMGPELLVLPTLGWSVSGGDALRWDTTVVVTPLGLSSDGTFEGMFGLEAGAWFRARHPDRFRVGVIGELMSSRDGTLGLPLLDLAYRHEEERWYLEAGTTGILLIQAVRLEAGLRF